MDGRVQEHQAAQSALEKNLPECTSAERWEKPTKYALMKRGRERAVKLYDDLGAAEAHRQTDMDPQRILSRPYAQGPEEGRMSRGIKWNIAKPTWLDGIRFSSKAEAKRYAELKLLQKAGEVMGLNVQPPFPIADGEA